MKEGQIIRTIQNNGETVIFRYPRWQDAPRVCRYVQYPAPRTGDGIPHRDQFRQGL